MNSADLANFKLSSVSAFKVGVSQNIPVERYDYDSNGNLIYEGIAPYGSLASDAAWLIRRTTYDGNNNLILKESSLGYQIWNNRAAISYA